MTVQTSAVADQCVVATSAGGTLVMGDRYLTSNLWVTFREDCPWISRVPVIQHWAFGVWARAYFRVAHPVWP